MKGLFSAIILVFLFIPMLAAAGSNTKDRPLVAYEWKYRENMAKRRELINKFGLEQFSLCFVCPQRDLDNPFAQSVCLIKAEYCLRGKGVPKKECGREGYVYSAGRCVTADDGCRERYGQFSYARGIDNDRKVICGCLSGFGWNDDRSRCIQTGCGNGDIYWSQYRNPDGSFLYGRCVARDDACRERFGKFSEFSRLGGDNVCYCQCSRGYIWSDDGQTCVEPVKVLGYVSPAYDQFVYEQTVAEESDLLSAIDDNLTSRLRGRILLQVEKGGEAWYVWPGDGKKYFLGSPRVAFLVMQKLGLGATHEFISGHKVFPRRVSGRILIDVDDHGRAYYIYPADRRAYYLGRPADAWRLMRSLGLGITNSDFRKIDIGKLKISL